MILYEFKPLRETIGGVNLIDIHLIVLGAVHRRASFQHLATAERHSGVPGPRIDLLVPPPGQPGFILEVVDAHSAALEVPLGVVPGGRDRIGLGSGRVLRDGVPHLGSQVVLHLEPEHVAEDAADDQHDEHEKQEDEVREQHALDLLDGAEAAEEADDDDDDSGHDEDVGRGNEEFVPQEPLDVGLVRHGPNAHGQHHQAADEDEEIHDEKRPFDALPATFHDLI